MKQSSKKPRNKAKNRKKVAFKTDQTKTEGAVQNTAPFYKNQSIAENEVLKKDNTKLIL